MSVKHILFIESKQFGTKDNRISFILLHIFYIPIKIHLYV